MRSIREILKSLNQAPYGFASDGQRIGVGLSAAMARAERDISNEVEVYLRDTDKADVKGVSR